MTLVTTSRKAIPEIRTLARAFAMATGSEFVTRGKMGLSDLFTRDTHIIIFTQETGGTRVQFFTDEDLVGDYLILSVRIDDRTDTAIHGLGTPQPGKYAALTPLIPVCTTGMETNPDTCIVDGPQKKRFFCRMVPYGA
ncbi:MAG: hypothetical protein ABFC24_10450 [Methanoregulaceae archaeon]